MVCLRRVGDSGKCAYILDLSDEGTKMVSNCLEVQLLIY